MNEFYAFLIQNVLRSYTDPFSTDLYNESLYGTVGYITIFSALFFNVLFYYILNRPSYSKWYFWLLTGLIHLVVCSLASFFIPKGKLDELLPDVYGDTDYLGFSLINCVAAFFLFMLFMLLIRWWSTNAKQTPFPH